MRVDVLGGAGAYPEKDRGCGGYLFRHDGFDLLIDPGYATHHALLGLVAAADVDAVLVTHGHPDHCADLHPLLRARAMSGVGVALPLYAPVGALDAVLALDNPATLDGAYTRHDLLVPGRVEIGPLAVSVVPTPHFLPNAGVRVDVGGVSVAYSGDGGPDAAFAELAAGADLLIAEATHATGMPPWQAGMLSTAVDAGRLAAATAARELWLTHLWPGSDHDAHLAAAASVFDGPIAIAGPGSAWPPTAS